MSLEKMYRACDFNGDVTRYLHWSGDKLTTKKKEAWLGTIEQFDNVCRIKEWDALKPIDRSKIG